MKHLIYCPFSGLGLHNGFRGNAWLKNRIQIFKQFVLLSLKAQTKQDFILWISWRWEEKNNPIVEEFIKDLNDLLPYFKIIHTFSGVCFYDDKYPDEVARDRLITAIHGALPDLLDAISGANYILMTIQPSDDCYHKTTVESLQKLFRYNPQFQAVGFQQGYICNYNTKELAEYNPETNPPFYTLKFPYDTFIDPLEHIKYTALKQDSGKYKVGTPLPSHEYVGECLKYALIKNMRGFLVGTHGANISTTFSNPYKGKEIVNYQQGNFLQKKIVLEGFGIQDAPVLKLKISPFKKIFLKFPHPVQRKLKYIFFEWKVFKLSTWPRLIK